MAWDKKLAKQNNLSTKINKNLNSARILPDLHHKNLILGLYYKTK